MQLLDGSEQIRAAVITPDDYTAMELGAVLEQLPSVQLVRKLTEYPDERQLQVFLQTQAPAILFIDTRWMSEALRVAESVSQKSRGTQMVAISRDYNAETLLTALRSGMREFLALPLNFQETVAAVSRLAAALRQNPLDVKQSQHVFSFLPAKPGSGASTIALNVSTALAQEQKGGVALMDFDLHCGMLDFMLKLPAGYGLWDAAEHSSRLDESLWERLVSKVGDLHFIRAGWRGDGKTIAGAQVQEVFKYASRCYDIVCLDHSGNLEPHSLQALETSTQVFLVCTPEVASLHAAKRTLDRFRDSGLADRVRIIVNRGHAGSPVGPEQIEDILGRGIFATVPNDYAAVQTSLAEGRSVAPGSPLGRRFAELGAKMAGREISGNKPRKTLLSRFKSFSERSTAHQSAS